ncbi:site-specific DNA-methyltransferase [Cereibacter sphaeroides]|nr:site-specific DNA-methyltransferase [Cereibacter sphaeroides]AZB69953.1 site-specific DNA-methyltransferase [Cereibacter sphaeroides]
MPGITILPGDCLASMRTLPDGSVDAVVTDPPYGLSFMGQRWDYDVPSVEIWTECLRVLKPGAHLLAFAGTRTQHRMAARIEDAGFEIRDMIAWVYGSGFPKSHNLSGDWNGWGTALKPSLEPITVARKPLIGTVAENVMEHGTGALNIDGCRVPTDGETNPSISRRQGSINHLSTRGASEAQREGRMESRQSPEAYRAERAGEAFGRWPANLIHDGSDEVTAAFPPAPGQQGRARVDGSEQGNSVFGALKHVSRSNPDPRGDEGSAARFFYCAKASAEDRNEGCEHLPSRPSLKIDPTSAMARDGRRGSGHARNHHPTVKPTDLMRYLCRLVTPPGGLILDPFMGSGSTGKAAVLEGFRFTGCELDPDHVAIAEARIEAAWWSADMFARAADA